MCLLGCDEDCGYFFDDPIVKEGIVLQFVYLYFKRLSVVVVVVIVVGVGVCAPKIVRM